MQGLTLAANTASEKDFNARLDVNNARRLKIITKPPQGHQVIVCA